MIAKSRNAAARKAPIRENGERIKRRINASVIALFPQGPYQKGLPVPGMSAYAFVRPAIILANRKTSCPNRRRSMDYSVA